MSEECIAAAAGADPGDGDGNDDPGGTQARNLLVQFINQRYTPDTQSQEAEMEGSEEDKDLDLHSIGRQLVMIADEIEDKEEYQALIRALAQSAVVGNQLGFTFYLRMFVTMVSRQASLSVAMVTNVIRMFIMMFTNRSFGRRVFDTLFSQSVPEKLPEEIKDMDDDAIRVYMNALESGEELVRHVRLMVIGMFGVGKTSLVQNILQGDVKDVESTVGIDVYVNHCTVEDGKWKVKNIGDITGVDYGKRLKRIMMEANGKMQSQQIAGTTPVSEESCGQGQQQPDIIYQRETEGEAFNKMKLMLDCLKENEDPFLADFMKQLQEAKPLDTALMKSTVKQTPSDTTVSIWDFAGQYIYYSTHHFFLSSRSIFLLVVDISRDLNDPVGDSVEFSPIGYQQQQFSCLDAFKFWLNSVHAHSCEEAGDIVPTVILVGTRRDMIHGSDEEKEAYKEDYFNKALEPFIGSPVIDHIHPKKYFVNNLDQANMVFDKIKAEVINIAVQQKFWDEKVPVKWILLERTIDSLKFDHGKEMITLEEIMEADSENEHPIHDKQEIILFLKFQHALGNLVFFDTSDLQENIILTPQWIIDAFRCFVSHFPPKKPTQLGLWKEYEDLAKLHPDLIDEIIENKEQFKDHKEQVIKYMEHLDIMAKPMVLIEEAEVDQEHVSDGGAQRGEGSGADEIAENSNPARKQIEGEHMDDNESKEDGRKMMDFYIVPCMLKTPPSGSIVDEIIHPKKAKVSPVLCFVFANRFLQPAVFHRLLAICIKKWALGQHSGKFLLFNGLAVFRVDKQTSLTLWLDDYSICARIALFTHKGQNISARVCNEIRKFIKKMLGNICGFFQKKHIATQENLPFEEHIMCEEIDLPAKCWLKAADFLKDDEIKCCKHSMKLPVTRDYALSHWFPEELKLCETKLDKKLCRVPTDRELNELSAHIGDEYWALGLHLGIRETRMQQIREGNIYNVRKRILDVLLEWKKRMKQVSVAFLRHALRDVGGDILEFDKVFDQFVE